MTSCKVRWHCGLKRPHLSDRASAHCKHFSLTSSVAAFVDRRCRRTPIADKRIGSQVAWEEKKVDANDFIYLTRGRRPVKQKLAG